MGRLLSGLLLGGIVCAAACGAAQYAAVARGDWMLVPGNGEGRDQVIARDEYTERTAPGTLGPVGGILGGGGGVAPAPLLDTSSLEVAVGEVKMLTVSPDGTVRSLGTDGEAAKVYWTFPASAAGTTPTSDVYVEGLAPGRTTLAVTLADGGTRHISIDVSPRAR